MRGFIKHIDTMKKFGFIRVGEREDYFFHYSDTEDWDEIVQGMRHGKVDVEFEPTRSQKGLRAANVMIAVD